MTPTSASSDTMITSAFESRRCRRRPRSASCKVAVASAERDSANEARPSSVISGGGGAQFDQLRATETARVPKLAISCELAAREEREPTRSDRLPDRAIRRVGPPMAVRGQEGNDDITRDHDGDDVDERYGESQPRILEAHRCRRARALTDRPTRRCATASS